MNDTQDADKRLALILGDAAAACLWAALIMLAGVYLSYLIFLTLGAGSQGMMERLIGVKWEVGAVIWVSALALTKITGFSFFATAVGLWVWKRRSLRRLEPSKDES